jgi:hypothetical protein
MDVKNRVEILYCDQDKSYKKIKKDYFCKLGSFEPMQTGYALIKIPKNFCTVHNMYEPVQTYHAAK